MGICIFQSRITFPLPENPSAFRGIGENGWNRKGKDKVDLSQTGRQTSCCPLWGAGSAKRPFTPRRGGKRAGAVFSISRPTFHSSPVAPCPPGRRPRPGSCAVPSGEGGGWAASPPPPEGPDSTHPGLCGPKSLRCTFFFSLFFFFFLNLFYLIYSLFGCVGSLLLRAGFL